MGKEHSEKEKTILDSPSPKLNKSMIAYYETGDLFADRLLFFAQFQYGNK